jgi:hypothetical protein
VRTYNGGGILNARPLYYNGGGQALDLLDFVLCSDLESTYCETNVLLKALTCAHGDGLLQFGQPGHG